MSARGLGVAAVLAVMIGLGVGVGVHAWQDANEPDQPVLCLANLAFAQTDVGAVATEDQYPPGDTKNCDLSDGPNPYSEPYLGFDCRIHYPDGTVGTDTVKVPNRDDGTCGIPEHRE